MDPVLPFFDQPVSPMLKPVSAPYAKGSKTSQAGAKKAEGIAGQQCQDLLALYRTRGDLTDQEAATMLGLERTTVIPRRHTLMRAGLVIEYGQRKNLRTGVVNTTWGAKK